MVVQCVGVCMCACMCPVMTGCMCLAVERLKVVMEDIECQISTIRDQQKLELVLMLHMKCCTVVEPCIEFCLHEY